MTPVSIVLENKDITGHELVLPLSAVQAMVSATATVSGGSPLPLIRMQFAREGGPSTTVSGQTRTVSFGPKLLAANPGTGATREATSMPAGEYRVTVTSPGPRAGGLPQGYSVASVKAGATDLLTETLTLAPGSTTEIAIGLAVSSPLAARRT